MPTYPIVQYSRKHWWEKNISEFGKLMANCQSFLPQFYRTFDLYIYLKEGKFSPTNVFCYTVSMVYSCVSIVWPKAIVRSALHAVSNVSICLLAMSVLLMNVRNTCTLRFLHLLNCYLYRRYNNGEYELVSASFLFL